MNYEDGFTKNPASTVTKGLEARGPAEMCCSVLLLVETNFA